MMALNWFSRKTKKKNSKAELDGNNYEQADKADLPEESPDELQEEKATQQLTRPLEENPDEKAGQTVELEMRPVEILPFEILEEIIIIHSDVHM